MITCFCEKCKYEFDTEDPEDPEEIIFCPQCHLTPARILPETPTRKLLREQRLARARRKKLLSRILILLAAALITYPMMKFWSPEMTNIRRSPLILWGIAAGALTGVWFRIQYQYHSQRTGCAAMVVTVLFCGTVVLLSNLSLRSFLYGICGILPGMIAAYKIASYEKEE